MTVITSIFFYLSILGISIFFSRLASKKNKFIYMFPVIIILTLIAGLRKSSVGTDTAPYMLSIENYLKVGKIVWPYNYFSKGYGIFVKLIYNIWHNYNFLLVIEAFIINSLVIYRFWDYKKEGSFVFIMYAYLLIIYLRTLNLNVQYIALSIVFFGTRYIEKNETIKFLIFVIVASFIHTSALIGFIYYLIKFMNFKHITKLQLFLKSIILIALIFIGNKVINILYLRYAQYLSGKESTIGLMVFIQIIIFLFMFFYHKRRFFYESEYFKMKFSQISLYYFIGIILSFSSYIIGNAGRISYYFMIFEPVFFGMIIKNKKTEIPIKICILLWITAYAVYVLVDGFKSTNYFPYNFFWKI